MTLPIRLDHFLKMLGLVETGGQAKQLIADGFVIVNSEVETRRRRKLNVGDEVELDGDVYTISAEES